MFLKLISPKGVMVGSDSVRGNRETHVRRDVSMSHRGKEAHAGGDGEEEEL